MTFPPPICDRLSVEPDAGAGGYVVVTGAPGCFPSPEDEGDELRCWVTTLSNGSKFSMLVEMDGSCVVLIEAESGEEILVATGYPNGDESQPCYLVVP